MTTDISYSLASTPVPEEVISAVYRYAVSHGTISATAETADDLMLGIADVQAAVSRLLDYSLLREDRADSRFVPVAPDIAAPALLSPLESEIYERREKVTRIQAWLGGLRQTYERDCPLTARSAAVEHVTGNMAVVSYLKSAGEECIQEAVFLRSGRPDAGQTEEFLHICQSLTERGIPVRVICEHRTRADFTARMKLRNLMNQGAEVRTVSHVPCAIVVFDRSVAVLLSSPDGQLAASRVRINEVAQFLADIFGHLWDAAIPVKSSESGYAEVADDLKHAVVSLMARGFTDEVLARKLGMSVRPCRRHIAAIMRDLGAESRFQAGVMAGQWMLDHA